MSAPNRLPEVIPHQGDVITRGNFASVGGMSNVQTSLPNDTITERARIVAFIEQESMPGEKAAGNVIEICDYICHNIPLIDQDTGEQFSAVRTLLIDSQGRSIAFVSTSIIQSLDRLCYAVGQRPPFDVPIMAKLTRRSIGKGRHIYTLSLEK